MAGWPRTRDMRELAPEQATVKASDGSFSNSKRNENEIMNQEWWRGFKIRFHSYTKVDKLTICNHTKGCGMFFML